MKRAIEHLVFAITLCGLAAGARADRPYVVIRDDGTIESLLIDSESDLDKVVDVVMDAYVKTGAAIPEVLSVWTTFPMGGDFEGTYFDPLGVDITGIGIEHDYGGPYPSSMPPLQSILFHNDVTRLATRAMDAGAANDDGFANYLFLLEFMHAFGPSIRVPGQHATELEGTTAHWSFFLDIPSVAGGSDYHDNGDGTYSTLLTTPAALKYSLLDLYLMGLANSMEVSPFTILEDAMPDGASAMLMDPTWGGEIAAHTYPWFGPQPVVIRGTPYTFTMNDVIQENGARNPPQGVAQTSWQIGFVLVVQKSASNTSISQLETLFDPIATGFAPAFSQATEGRGSLDVVTPGDAGAYTVDAGTATDMTPENTVDAAAIDSAIPPQNDLAIKASDMASPINPDAMSGLSKETISRGCSLSGHGAASGPLWPLSLLALGFFRRARRRGK